MAAAESQKEQKIDDFTGLEGVGEKTAQILVKAGFKTMDSLANAAVESLTALQGIGEKTAQKIINSAKKHGTDTEQDTELTRNKNTGQ